jgi:hypothetical protein
MQFIETKVTCLLAEDATWQKIWLR